MYENIHVPDQFLQETTQVSFMVIDCVQKKTVINLLVRYRFLQTERLQEEIFPLVLHKLYYVTHSKTCMQVRGRYFSG